MSRKALIAAAIGAIVLVGYVVYHEALDRLPEGALTMTILWLIVIATTYLPCAIAILRGPNIPGADFFRSRVTPQVSVSSTLMKWDT
jgi:hypothetical protein